MPKNVICIGAGPAGLTAALKLAQAKIPVVVLERDPEYVGGISKTVRHKKFFFDVGGHRFFSKSREIEDLWTEILPNDILIRPRSSQIYYRKIFLSYPLKVFEALFRLGLVESFACAGSYLIAKIFPVPSPKNFEEWVVNQFGQRLFDIFFRTYTEKVWGRSCKEISADWAAQRIKGLNFASVIWASLTPKSFRKMNSIKSLIETFRYPRLGPGMLWEACSKKIQGLGGLVIKDAHVTGLQFDGSLWTLRTRSADGRENVYQATDVISSAPLREIVQSLSPPPAARALQAAGKLAYRDFITVALMMKAPKRFSSNWIYIHDPEVRVGRIQNFKSWSPEMVPGEELSCYGLEYFCFQNDSFWSKSDADLIEIAKDELFAVGLIGDKKNIFDGAVVRQAKAYPVYDDSYKDNVSIIRQELLKYPGLHLVGRNGMHKYNNQDHAMMTAILTVKNILANKSVYDVWGVNQDAEYHEEQA